MALRHDDLSPEERARQDALDRSWRGAQESLADPEFRAYLDASIERVNRSDAKPMTAEEFLARTENLLEQDEPLTDLVALRDIAGFHRWVDRENPSQAAGNIARIA